MGIPTEVVGSLPRPAYLQEALAKYDQGALSRAELTALQDKAAQDAMTRMEATGEPLVTDGEARNSSFATYPLVDTLGGKGLASNLDPQGQLFAVFDDGHHRQLPRLTAGPFRYRSYAWQNVERNIQAGYPQRAGVKTAVIAPSMLSLLYPLQGEVEGYPREKFLDDLVDECEKDVRGCFRAGARRVSIDFTEGRLTAKRNPRNPWTNANLLQSFIDLNNRLLDRFTPEERANIGVHTCPGGDCDSVHSAEVPYHELLPTLFQMNAGYFLIQLASEKDKEAVYKEIGQHIRRDARGVKQVAFVGVTNPLDPRVETDEEVRNALVAASRHIPVDQLGATDDCGFSPFSIDAKPRHGQGGPDFARDVAFRKIAARVRGARLASEVLGV